MTSALESYLAERGILNAQEIIHNPSYDKLFQEETAPSLTGYDVGYVTESGAVSVDTGIHCQICHMMFEIILLHVISCLLG